jgi:hypothetical protein
MSRALRHVLAAAALLAPAGGHAVERSCGPDPLANTTLVLCAPPSGPCDATDVRLSADVEVTAGGCTFALGGRRLTVSQTFQMVSGGAVRFENAGAVTITATGGLEARGDYGVPGIGSGGTLTIASAGTVTHAGLIDVYGDPGGQVKIDAAGDVVLESGSAIRGVGNSLGGGGEHLADGARVAIATTGGSILVGGDILLRGQSDGAGGDLRLRAARNVHVTRPVDASGGASGGGSIRILAGDDIIVTRTLDVESRGGGGPGGEISFAAGEDSLGGVVTGGSLGIDDGILKLDASSSGDSDEDGGSLVASARGDVVIADGATIRASAAVETTGSGGSIDLAADGGDVMLEAPVTAQSGGDGGDGGRLSAAGGDVTVAATADLTLDGTDVGGELSMLADGIYAQASTVLANGTGPSSTGGDVAVEACDVSLGDGSRLEANGATGGSSELTGRDAVTVSASSRVEATGSGGRIELVTRTFGHCSNDPGRSCHSAAECTVGCSTGQCLDVNPDTGGTTTQFDPAPGFVAAPALAACP